MDKNAELRKDELCQRNSKQIWFMLPTLGGKEGGEGKTELETKIKPPERHRTPH